MAYGIASERIAQFQRAEEAYLEAALTIEATGDRLAYLGAKKTWANLGGRFAEDRAPIAVLQARLNEARGLGDGRMVALYMSSLATAYGRAGKPDRDLEIKKSLLELARRMGDEVLETAILEKLGALQLQARRFEEASRYAEAAIGMARRRGDIGAEAAALGLLGAVQGDSGRYAAQAESLQRLLVIHERRSDTGAWAASAVLLAHNLIRRGLPGEALQAFLEIEERTDSYYSAAGSPSLLFAAPGDYPIAYEVAQLHAFGESFAMPTLELVDRQRARFLGGARGRTLRALQESLPEDLAFVEFVLARSGRQPGYLWLATRKDVRLFRTAADVPTEDDIRRTAEALERPDGINRTDSKEWERLSELLLGPLRGQLGARRLVIVLDEAMARLPVAYMLDPDHSDGSRLGDHHLVTYAPAMLLAGEIAAERETIVDLMIAGDPVTSRRDLRMSRRDGTTQFSRLVYAEEEAREVARAAGGRRVQQWMGFEATRERVAGAMGDARIVHLISHGVTDWDKLRNSGLALTMWDRNGRAANGMLRFEEIAGSSLRAELVTLSACDTAVGRVVGYNGIPSLANAFLRAGARRVVSTLWKVDDAATAALMGAFYRNLFAGGKVLPGEALWKAQMYIAGQRRWRAPYYWAGFTLSGDWGSL
jgi:CHAT domain-containing protein